MADSPYRLLLIEDDPEDAFLVRELLVGLASIEGTRRGFEVEQSTRLDEGLDLAQGDGFDLLLLDLELPDSEGHDTIARARAAVPSLPIIVLTERDDEATGYEAVQRGAQDFLSKNNLNSALLRRSILSAIERHHLSAELDRRAQELHTLLRVHETTIATIPSALLVLDRGLNVVMANRRYLEVTDADHGEVVGRNVADILPHTLLQGQGLHERIRRVSEDGGEDTATGVLHESADHDCKFLDIRICGVHSPEGAPSEPRVLIVIEDVTQQTVLERQLRQAAKMESVGQLASGVAHDFNNLLTGMKGYAQLALRSAGAESTVSADLNEICELATRASNLTRQLLVFGRQQPMDPVPTDLNMVVEDMLGMLRRLIGEHIELALEAGEDLGLVLADPSQIEQVVMNLAVNARDAMPQGGKLLIRTMNTELTPSYVRTHLGSRAGPKVQLSVRDTGCGMDEETRDHIFEPFFTTKELGRGTGLGLAVVYGVVKQHSGYIWVDSELDKGTTFDIFLDRVDANGQHKEEDEAPEPAPAGSETILLVEDEPAVRLTIQRALEFNGYSVSSAANPAEARALFDQQGAGHFQLLVTDVVLPGGSGPGLFDSLVGEDSGLKVLFMSGYSSDTVVAQGAIEEGRAFIQKPFGPQALLAKVRGVLDVGEVP